MKNLLLKTVPVSRITAIIAFFTAFVAVIVAAIISYEKLALALNPNHVTSCSFNPIVSCSPVMQSWQAAAFFGIPNPFFGLIGFAVVMTVAFLAIFVELPRLVWVLNFVGTAGAMAFCFWLSTQALFSIGALCLYCCGIWVLTTILFWISINRVTRKTKYESFGDYGVIGAVAFILIFAVMVFIAFQTFWLSLLP